MHNFGCIRGTSDAFRAFEPFTERVEVLKITTTHFYRFYSNFAFSLFQLTTGSGGDESNSEAAFEQAAVLRPDNSSLHDEHNDQREAEVAAETYVFGSLLFCGLSVRGSHAQ